MAKIKLSAIVSEMRGKLNGSVFSKNRGGAYLRTKVTPVNPNTASQGAVRGALTGIAQTWRTLTEAQRKAWNTAVSNFTKTDIFGDVRNPSGINLFTRLCMNLNNIGISYLTDPPLPAQVTYMENVVVVSNETTPAMTVALDTIGGTGTCELVIEATPMMSAGKDFVKSEFRVIDHKPETTSSPIDILAKYTAKFGAPVTGQKVFVRLKMVDPATGLTSGYFQSSTITL